MSRSRAVAMLDWGRSDRSCIKSGRGAAWLARLLGVQEVPGSNPGGPTRKPFFNQYFFSPSGSLGEPIVLKNVHKIHQLAISVLETPRSFACRSSLANASRIIPSFA